MNDTLSKNEPNFENLNTYLYRQIKEMVWDKILRPGEKIKQEHLAKELGVSRTPLIKVLERLTSERLLEYIPRRGYFVKKLTLEETLDLFSVRIGLESVAVKEVVEKATDEEIEELKQCFRPFGGEWTKEKKRKYLKADQQFHARLFEIANNGLLTDINEMFNIYRFSYQKGLMRDPAETLSEHQEILNQIEERDAKLAQIKMMEHLEISWKNIRKVFEEKLNNDGEINW